MEETAQTTESRAHARDFAPVHSCGGLIAAVGLVLAAGGACLVALPISSTADSLPVWLAWIFRLAPIPAVVVLWAVVSEGAYRARADAEGLHLRRGLGGVTTVPWDEVTDTFADCGRPVAHVVAGGGSMVEDEGVDALPFEAYGPEFTVLSAHGVEVLPDSVDGYRALVDSVPAHTGGGVPMRWEEASWVMCPSCAQRMAVSVWPSPGLGVSSGCSACGQAPTGLLPEDAEGFVVQVRGGPPVTEAVQADYAPPREEPGPDLTEPPVE